jgi:tetratricopeptide (TPR) repeat protein
MISRNFLLLLLAAGCATAAPAPTTGTTAKEAADDLAIEAELTGIEAAARRGQGLETMARFARRPDFQGKVLAAWADPDLQGSWNKFHALSDFNKTDVWTEIGAGHVYIEWKTLDQAAAALDRAIAKNPNIAEAHVLRGQLLRLQSQPVDAAVEEQKALDLNPGDAFALNELGLDAQARGDEAGARQRFGEARKSWPDDYVASRALTELDEADSKAKLVDLEELQRLAPKDQALWLESGKLREKTGDLPGAARDFETARKGGAQDPELLRVLAKTYREQGRDDDERLVLEDMAGPKADGDVLRRLAELEVKKGDTKSAMRDFKKAIAANAKDSDSRLALARLAVTSGQLSAAIGAFRDVVGAKPEAQAELDGLETQAQLSKKPIEGNVVKINTQLGAQLNKLYRTLLADKPALGGELKLRVVVKKDGSVEDVEVLEDSVGDPALAANLYWNAHDAHFPHGDAKYVFKFNLTP